MSLKWQRKNRTVFCANFSDGDPMESIAVRLKRLRESATPKITIRGLAALLGVPASTYAAYEDAAKFKKSALPLDLAKRIAAILAPHGVAEADILALAGLSVSDVMPTSLRNSWRLKVQGEVAAGVWREQSEWSEDMQYDLEVGPPPFASAERFAVHLVGRSMDKVISPGSDLECLRVQFGVVEPKPGDIVIVERHRHGLTEMTCKRLARDGDDWVLVFESHQPEFQGEIRLGSPNENVLTDEEINICGIVLSARKALFSSV